MAWPTDMTVPTNLPDLQDDATVVPERGSVRGDPTWIAPALTTSDKTRNVGKTNVFFGPWIQPVDATSWLNRSAGVS